MPTSSFAALATAALAIVGLALLPSTLSANSALEGYTSYVALTEQIRQLDESDLVQVRSLGKSLEDRELWLIVVGDGEVDKKPAIVVVGNVQPAHLVGGELALKMAMILHAFIQEFPCNRRALMDEMRIEHDRRPAPDATN